MEKQNNNSRNLYMYINIAGFNIEFIFYQIKQAFIRNRLIKLLNKRYSGFITKDISKKIDFTIKVRAYEHIELFFNKDTRKGYLQIYKKENDNTIVTYYSNVSHYNLLLIEIITQLLNKTGGFIFHQSSVDFGDGIVLFSGPPNAGKTTVARLMSKRYPIISSDNGIIKYENGELYFYQTTFYDSLNIKGNNRKYKIKKIYFLTKSRKFLVKDLTDKQEEVLEKVNQQILQNTPYSKKQFKHIINFVYKADFAELYFAKNSNKLINLVKEDLSRTNNNSGSSC